MPRSSPTPPIRGCRRWGAADCSSRWCPNPLRRSFCWPRSRKRPVCETLCYGYMTVHLVNPSHLSFGVGVITPRWLFVLAAATPATYGRPHITDETLEALDFEDVHAGDIVGIGIHTGNALRGYEIGTEARARGATVVFGGIHATLYPDEAHELGGAHAIVRGDGDVMWPRVLDDAASGRLQRVYEGGRIDADRFVPARWELLPEGRY